MASADQSTGAEPSRGAVFYAFAEAARTAELPDHVRAKTEMQVLDTVAAIVSGAALEAGRAAQAYVTGLGGRGDATILGTRIKASMVDVAFANGMSAHADESDDSHETSQTHPGCAILPAVLAVAEARGSTGDQVLRATWMAYELIIRFGEAVAPAMSFARSSRSCHAHTGLFGAGLAAGSLMGFRADQFRVLANYLAQEASGLTTWRLDTAHTLKSYTFSGMPAANGTRAAALVDAGFTGDGDVLDTSDRNIFDAISPDCDISRLDPPYDSFRILETDIKKYSVGFPIAAPVAALEALIDTHGLAPGAVSALRVRYHLDWYNVIGDENRMADLNLRYCLAATLLNGKLDFATTHDGARMEDPAILDVAERIAFLPPEDGQDRFEARIEVDTPQGALSERQGLMVKGRMGNPMTLEEVRAKAHDLLSSVMTGAKADDVIAAVADLPRAKDIGALVALCAP
ncbi:MmgE/PrpD family protein [Tropicimonas sp. IMCC34011]|uniref:MmgE/PrpD family protein n=1 Tax=Tropicimonas sp. IMCC34011 TaxID=2248759 RepID=UPI00130027A8|nr:MmgE/PrpD family protein [Tropicimonas sp. IMCC34011]